MSLDMELRADSQEKRHLLMSDQLFVTHLALPPETVRVQVIAVRFVVEL